MAKFHSLKVKDVRRETADAVSVSFEVPPQLMADYQFKQGQYLTLKLTVNGEEIRRSYSICTSPFSEKDLRIAVKEVEGGRASTNINRHLKVGDVMEVMTPMGNFHSVLSGSNKKNYVLFAGGSGITPMMSILKSVLYIEKQSTVVLFYANRDEKSVIFDAEIKKLASEYADRLKVINVFDKPEAEINELYKGFITPEKVIAFSEGHIGLHLDNEYFICGPGPMMENVKQGLEKLKVESKRVHIEYFTAVIEAVAAAEGKAAPSGEAVNSNVTVIQYGMETSFKLNTNGINVLDAALDAGVDVPYSCKGAVCCTCRAKVIEGKAKMDANFALTDSEVEEGFILTCQAHPLTEKLVVDYDAI
ncbi:MAG: phenylacetate-CoA oxygenase/reductase, PaaK subunit [Bacteroidetes bacterium]|jgi:ring-1,2-phenylacetyl-CoA epoxidase subunit PaaE|nr:phenylacetate-CoA oxygenase/reductase, PaaK subunit [Bacteroidota bacterium]